MSDYSFLKSGFSNLKEPAKITENEKENIELMLSLFTSNALINASKYVKLCNRHTITKTDISYGLKYEVFEFLNREDINEGLAEIRKDYENLKLEDYDVSDTESCEDYESDTENGTHPNEEYNKSLNTGLEDFIVPDNETEPFKRINENSIDNENKDFVAKFHNYNDTWDDWVPQTPLENILKRSLSTLFSVVKNFKLESTLITPPE